MKKEHYEWLMDEYMQALEDHLTGEIQDGITWFLLSGRSKEIYYNVATLYRYGMPLWYVAIITRYKVKKAIKNTVLEPFVAEITKKMITMAKAKALSISNN